MKTILICNQKGGVGKTVLADELAFALERDNITYSFYDLDEQGSGCHNTNDVEGAEVAIVDTPGALQEDMKYWVDEADYVLVPTLLTDKEQEPLMRMIDILSPHMADKPVVFILNKWKRSKTMTNFVNWFTETYPDLKYFVLNDYEIIREAGSKCKSVYDINKKHKATAQIMEIYSAIKDAIGI